MQPIDWNHILSHFAENLLTFITVVLAWINTHAKISETRSNLNPRIDDTNARFDKRFHDLKKLMRAEFAALRAETKRDPAPLIRER